MKIQKKVSAKPGSTGTEPNHQEQSHAAAHAERLKTRQKLPLLSMLEETNQWIPPLPPEGFEFANFYHL